MPKKKSKSAAARYAQASQDKRPRHRATRPVAAAPTTEAVATTGAPATRATSVPQSRPAPATRRAPSRSAAATLEIMVRPDHVAADLRHTLMTAGPLVLLMIVISLFVA